MYHIQSLTHLYDNWKYQSLSKDLALYNTETLPIQSQNNLSKYWQLNFWIKYILKYTANKVVEISVTCSHNTPQDGQTRNVFFSFAWWEWQQSLTWFSIFLTTLTPAIKETNWISYVMNECNLNYRSQESIKLNVAHEVLVMQWSLAKTSSKQPVSQSCYIYSKIVPHQHVCRTIKTGI